MNGLGQSWSLIPDGRSARRQPACDLPADYRANVKSCANYRLRIGSVGSALRQSIAGLIAPARLYDPVGEHGGEAAGLGVRSQLLHAQPHFSSPVGILPGGSGQVLLL